MKMFISPAPSIDMTRMTNSRRGKAYMTSMKRVRNRSGRPPTIARQRADRHADRHDDDLGAEPDQHRHARAVDHPREQIAPELVGAERVGRATGASLSRPKFVLVYGSGARTSAKIATRHSSTITTPPAIASLLRSNRRQASRQRLEDRATSLGSERQPDPEHALPSGVGERPGAGDRRQYRIRGSRAP